jgi:hypothetical protein
MSKRLARPRRASTALAVTVGMALAVAGCGGGEEPPESPSSSRTTTDGGGGTDDGGGATETQVLAQVKSGEITLEITSAVREEGGFVTVRGTVSNSGS